MIELRTCTVNFRATATGSLYSCLNIYNSPYTNVRFLPVTTTFWLAVLYNYTQATPSLLELHGGHSQPPRATWRPLPAS